MTRSTSVDFVLSELAGPYLGPWVAMVLVCEGDGGNVWGAGLWWVGLLSLSVLEFRVYFCYFQFLILISHDLFISFSCSRRPTSMD